MDGLRFGSLFSEWDFPCKEKFTKHSSGTLQKIKNFQSCYISLQRMVLTCKALAIAIRTIAIAIVAKKAIEYCNMQ